jgi:Uma2 family endonuclease
MSTIAATHRRTLEEYERRVEAGEFGDHSPYVLIDGVLVEQMTENDPHAAADTLVADELDRIKPAGWHVRHGKPIRIPSRQSKPEPDQTVVRGKARDYAKRSPEPSDVALVIEVSDSSLIDDRRQAEAYGMAGIPVYWIVNLIDGQVEVYSAPGADGYENLEVLMPGHVLSVIIGGVEVGEIAVDDILP